MLFRAPTVALALLFVGQTAVALTPAQVVKTITVVTNESKTINRALMVVDTEMTYTQVSTISVTVVQGFTNIATQVTNAVTMIGTAKPFKDEGATLVVHALLDFVKVHQALLSTVIGKHSIFAQFFLTAPIAAILRTLEATIDSFAVALISIIPTKKNSAQNGFNQLGASVDNCIKTYSEFCLPSVLYPATMPICVHFKD